MEKGNYSPGYPKDRRNKCQRWDRIGTVIFFLGFILVLVSYVAPDWIQVNFIRADPESKFRKLGLWLSCYKNLYDQNSIYSYQGCRWIYSPVGGLTYDFVLPSFIVAVQIMYTLCFITVVILSLMIWVYIFRYNLDRPGTLAYLIVIGIMLQLAGLLGTVSVIVFGRLSSSRYWTYQWQSNDLSWAFNLAVIGSVLLHFSGIFFIVEACRLYRKRKRKDEGRTSRILKTYPPAKAKPRDGSCYYPQGVGGGGRGKSVSLTGMENGDVYGEMSISKERQLVSSASEESLPPEFLPPQPPHSKSLYNSFFDLKNNNNVRGRGPVHFPLEWEDDEEKNAKNPTIEGLTPKTRETSSHEPPRRPAEVVAEELMASRYPVSLCVHNERLKKTQISKKFYPGTKNNGGASDFSETSI